MVQYNSLFFEHRKSRMICNMMTSTIALLRMSKKRRQKTLSNQQQAKRLKFVLQKKPVRPAIH